MTYLGHDYTEFREDPYQNNHVIHSLNELELVKDELKIEKEKVQELQAEKKTLKRKLVLSENKKRSLLDGNFPKNVQEKVARQFFADALSEAQFNMIKKAKEGKKPTRFDLGSCVILHFWHFALFLICTFPILHHNFLAQCAMQLNFRPIVPCCTCPKALCASVDPSL